MPDYNIRLSFCIPTYNNVKSVYRLVSSILNANDDLDIEVIVLDNGSTDDTLTVLSKIEDKRFNVYTNGENKGALFNMMNVLDKGKGQFLVYCTDHDHVNEKKIADFKSFLKNNQNVAFGYCEYYSKSNFLFDLFKSGHEALNALAYVTRHPTGYYFKREFWHKIESVKKFSNYDYVDLFPLEFVFAELALLGDGAVYQDSIFRPETGERVVKHKSATTKGNSKNAFFAPECRLKLAINFRKHITSLSISEKYKQSLIIDSFLRELEAATFNYRSVLINEKLCIHYHMEMSKLSRIELLKIVLNFYTGYIKEFNFKNFMFFHYIKFFSQLFLYKPKTTLSFIYRFLFR